MPPLGNSGGTRAVQLLGSVVFLFALGGCQRGCLSRWLIDRGAPSSPGPAGEPGFTLEGTDCADGFLRCVDGRIEASRVAHVPHPCGAGKTETACACPWDALGRCASGCAADGLEVLAPPSDAGAAQLCRPDAPVARPVLPGDSAPAEICAGRSVSCVDGIVRTCETAGRIAQSVAVCLHGCSMDVAIDLAGENGVHGAVPSLDGVVAILCRRDHAERR